jgi:UDP-3-O-[3-hydroxymyristoyl] glucosamine N-acyltransferase
MPAEYRLAEIVARLGGELIGDGDVRIRRVASLASAGPGDIVFLVKTRHLAALESTSATAAIVAEAERDATTLPRIVTPSPYLYFARVSTLLHPPPPFEPGVHARAAVHPTARIDPGARIDACAVVEAEAEVGVGSWIGPGCWVGQGTSIGPDSRLHGGVRVYPNCRIGKRVIVHSGAVIGADGFGFAPDQGAWIKIPQVGRVLIGDDVEIGANTTIDRGALDDTIIEDGVKLDNLIQIAHNCRIGAHTAIAGCAGVAGSTTIGRYCMIGGAAMISGHITIGDHVHIAGGTGVAKSINEPGMYISAIPAMPDRKWGRIVALLRGLERINERLRGLERAMGLKGNRD